MTVSLAAGRLASELLRVQLKKFLSRRGFNFVRSPPERGECISIRIRLTAASSLSIEPVYASSSLFTQLVLNNERSCVRSEAERDTSPGRFNDGEDLGKSRRITTGTRATDRQQRRYGYFVIVSFYPLFVARNYYRELEFFVSVRFDGLEQQST